MVVSDCFWHTNRSGSVSVGSCLWATLWLRRLDWHMPWHKCVCSSIPFLYIAGNTSVAGSIDTEYEVLSLETNGQS